MLVPYQCIGHDIVEPMRSRNNPRERDDHPARDERGAPSAALTPFTATWLRTHCGCAQCRDPGSGQHLLDLAAVPVDTTVGTVVETDTAITITFVPDGHRATFTHTWLAAQRDRAVVGDGRTERDKQLWTATGLPDPLPRTPWMAYCDDATARATILDRVHHLGFAILTGAPTTDQTVAQIAASFGFVRETEYGRVFDVRVQPDGLALTRARLEAAR